MEKEISVCLIGHKFMGKAHNHAYSNVSHYFDTPFKVVKKVLCGKGDDLKDTAARWGWNESCPSWEDVVQRKDIDVIDIAAPSTLHKEITLAAAKASKHVLCEKPLALSLADAREMYSAVQQAGVKHTVGFNYRKVPAIGLARQLIEEGALGSLFHFRGIYSQDWLVDPSFPLAWRLRKKDAGGGASWDMGAHVIDLARYLVGDLAEVVGMQNTFIQDRPIAVTEDGLSAVAGKQRGVVDVDDTTSVLARFKSGALGLLQTTRLGTGHRNENRIEVNGSKGSFIFNMEKMNELEFFSVEDQRNIQGFRRIQVTDSCHPYTKNWWPVGHLIGFGDTFVNEIYDFLLAIAEDRPAEPSFLDGLKVQAILEAIDQSIVSRRLTEVGDL